MENTIAHDVIKLPSLGLSYKNKNKSLKVAYLNGYDENLLFNQKLIDDNLAFDELIKSKILDKDFDFEELTNDDKFTILVFLRNCLTDEYNIELIDPKTEKTFPHVLKLDTIKTNDIVPELNQNGFIEFVTKSGKKIEFRYLNPKEEKFVIERETARSQQLNIKIPETRTAMLVAQIVSIDGNGDKLNIERVIKKNTLKENYEIRKFIDSNKPGLNLNYSTKSPSGQTVDFKLQLGVEFFRPFWGL
jgi:hypothetical protein